MWFPSWQRNRNGSHARERILAPQSPCRRANFRPRLDALEDRRLLSTLTVTNNLDSGKGSLRADISKAHNGDTIVFASSLAGQTINLTSGELLIKANLTISGLGADKLTISAGNSSRVFEVAARYQVALSGLTIANGNGNGSEFGGAIYNTGTLTVSGCTLSGNRAVWGGAIMNQESSTLTVSGCTFSGNQAGGGGGIFTYGNATISNSTFSGNSSDPGHGGAIECSFPITLNVSGCTLTDNNDGTGAAIYVLEGTVTISNTTFSGNGYGQNYIVGPWIDGGGNTFGP
jgi:hypothetical protein